MLYHHLERDEDQMLIPEFPSLVHFVGTNRLPTLSQPQVTLVPTVSSTQAICSRRLTQQKPHSLLMIPGPIEYSDAVLHEMSTPPLAHTGLEFVGIFSQVLTKLRLLFGNSKSENGGQPLVVSGSGTLGWDFLGANLITNHSTDNILCVSTGFFSNSMYECLSSYVDDETSQITVLEAPVGEIVSLEAIGQQLSSKKYNLITMTQTDTSTGVLLDVEKIAKLVHEVSPDTLIAVDAVCSAGVEEIQFDNWGLDFVMSASQKALSTPAGLSIMMVSQRGIDTAYLVSQKKPLYASFNKWLPIMINYENKKPSYFATPSVQLISALNVSLTDIVGLEPREIDAESKLPVVLLDRFEAHKRAAAYVRETLVNSTTGLQTIAQPPNWCNGMTALYMPESIAVGDFIQHIQKTYDISLAGGIHPKCATKYFRVGHMGISVTGENGKDLKRTVEAILVTLEALKPSTSSTS